MQQPIKVYKPSGSFGKLSNQYKKLIDINGEKWKTVSNYVYANLLKNPIYRLNIKNVDYPDKLYNEYTKMYKKSINDTLWDAYSIGYAHLCDKNPVLSKTLLQTGQSNLIYRSDNILIGVNSEGKGDNIIGKVLENLRYRIKNTLAKQRKEELKDKRNDKLYKAYITYVYLKDLLYAGNNLNEFEDMTFKDIIENKIGDNVINKDLFLSNIVSTMPFFINEVIDDEDINTLISIVKKNELRKFSKILYNKKRLIVLNLYIEYLIDQQYPDLSPENKKLAQQQTLRQLSKEQEIEMSEKLYSSWKENLLPEELNEKIDKNVDEVLAAPPLAEIEEAEGAFIKKRTPDNKQTKRRISDTDNLHNISQIRRLIDLIDSTDSDSNKKQADSILAILDGPNGFSGYIDRQNKRVEEINQMISSNIGDKTELTRERDAIIAEGFYNIKPETIDARTKQMRKSVESLMETYNIERALNLEKFIKLTRNEDVNLVKRGIISQEEADINFEREMVRYIIDKKQYIDQLVEDVEDEEEEKKIHKRPIITEKKIGGKETVYQEGDIIAVDIGVKKIGESFKGFSPDQFSMLTINNFVYPTISHYATTSLYYHMILAIPNMEEAYKRILINPENIGASVPEDFKNLYTISSEYGIVVNIDRDHFEKYNAEIAMEYKFRDDDLQDLLLETKDAEIIYEDLVDSILGIGPLKDGLNFVGKQLVIIRDRIKISREDLTKPIVSSAEMLKFINSSPVMRVWAEQNIIEMSNIVNILSNYTEIDKTKLTLFVLRNFGNNTEIIQFKNKEGDKPFIKDIIINSTVFNNVSEYMLNFVVEYFKTYIFSKLTLLIRDNQINTGEDIINFITTQEQNKNILSNKCNPIILPQLDNCILNALINIIGAIKTLDENIDMEDSVKIAGSIILGENILHNAVVNDVLEENRINILLAIEDIKGDYNIDETISLLMGMVNIIKNFESENKIKNINKYNLIKPSIGRFFFVKYPPAPDSKKIKNKK